MIGKSVDHKPVLCNRLVSIKLTDIDGVIV